MSKLRGVEEVAEQKHHPGVKTNYTGIKDIDEHDPDVPAVDERTGYMVVPNDAAGGFMRGGVLHHPVRVEVYADAYDPTPEKRMDVPATYAKGAAVPRPPAVKSRRGGRKSARAPEPADLVRATVSGPWGEMEAECSAVVREGVALALVGCSWTPPASDDVLTVKWDGGEVDAYSPGVSLDIPGAGRVSLLFVEEDS